MAKANVSTTSVQLLNIDSLTSLLETAKQEAVQGFQSSLARLLGSRLVFELGMKFGWNSDSLCPAASFRFAGIDCLITEMGDSLKSVPYLWIGEDLLSDDWQNNETEIPGCEEINYASLRLLRLLELAACQVPVAPGIPGATLQMCQK